MCSKETHVQLLSLIYCFFHCKMLFKTLIVSSITPRVATCSFDSFSVNSHKSERKDIHVIESRLTDSAQRGCAGRLTTMARDAREPSLPWSPERRYTLRSRCGSRRRSDTGTPAGTAGRRIPGRTSRCSRGPTIRVGTHTLLTWGGSWRRRRRRGEGEESKRIARHALASTLVAVNCLLAAPLGIPAVTFFLKLTALV